MIDTEEEKSERKNPPGNKEDMLIVMVHELIMLNKKHSNEKHYLNLPKPLQKTLAKTTNNVTDTWADIGEDKRMAWWNMRYGNLRFALGLTGLKGGGEALKNRLIGAHAFFQENQKRSIMYGLKALQKTSSEETYRLLEEMNLPADEWIPHINEHGEETLHEEKESGASDVKPLLEEVSEQELNDLEQKQVKEMKKLSRRLGGDPPSAGSPQQTDRDVPRLKIWSGIPGTGKSFQLQENVKGMVSDENEDVFRTVFHPEYSMYDFVGQIRPTQEPGGTTISYPFEPGPFTRALCRARNATDNKVFLIIEELNRGNAAAIFGEIFQLLDLADNGESEYGIVQKDIARVLGMDADDEIKLPENLYIYATMNISDQNVFALDTAFLRRWDREYVFADKWEGACTSWNIALPNDKTISWQSFAENINDWLIDKAGDFGINHPEDKRLGPWFVDQRTCNNPLLFANKVFTYLWTNVFSYSQARKGTFSGEITTLERVLKEFTTQGLGIFSDKLATRFDGKTEPIMPPDQLEPGKATIISGTDTESDDDKGTEEKNEEE